MDQPLLAECLALALTKDRSREGTDALFAIVEGPARESRRWCVAYLLLKGVMSLTLPHEIEEQTREMEEIMAKEGADLSFTKAPPRSPAWVTGAVRFAAWGDRLGCVVVSGPQSVVEETLRRMGTGAVAVGPTAEGEA